MFITQRRRFGDAFCGFFDNRIAQGRARIDEFGSRNVQPHRLHHHLRRSLALGADRAGRRQQPLELLGSHLVVAQDRLALGDRLPHVERPRIVGLGDSSLFGWRVPLEDTSLKVLERMLNAAGSTTRTSAASDHSVSVTLPSGGVGVMSSLKAQFREPGSAPWSGAPDAWSGSYS